jgi:transcriptional regulator GlxA family with amidase domain
MLLGIPVYEGVNLLDVAGPLEMFFWAGAPKKIGGQAKDLTTVLISEDGQPVTSINKVRFEVGGSFGNTQTLDILWVPGGDPDSLVAIMKDLNSPYLTYLRQVASGAKWVCSVCEGALLLARAGLLDGHKATTHWAFVNCLKKFPKIDVDTKNKRFIVSDNRLTGGGISSGLDEALKLIWLLFDEKTAENVQKTTQYLPQPPVSGKLDAPEACWLNWG